MKNCFPQFVALLCLLLTSLFCSPSFGQTESSPGKTIIILDASGSMWGQIDGKPKIEIARDSITELIETLDPNIELGLMAYGHREKGDCEDIELLVEPGIVNKTAFLSNVTSIIPKGKTPLTDAVEQAAHFLKYEEEKANVILVSDGLETCDRDPCELASNLAKNGIGFRAHIIAFDLTAEESESFRCLADETGGAFLQAQDAATLKDALEIAVEELALPAEKVEVEMKKEDLGAASIKAPASVPAGSVFNVEWEGPDKKGDYVTVVPKETKDGRYGNYAYTRRGKTLELTAPMKVGPAEVRYLAGGGHGVLGRVEIRVTPVEAMLDSADEVVAGSMVSIQWAGPDNKGDYITIVPAGAKEGTYKKYTYTCSGSPAEVQAISEPGKAEVRYVSGQGGITLASKEITVIEADVLVSGPEAVEAGQEVDINWKGPANKGDYITIVKADSGEGTYNDYAYTAGAEKSAVTIDADEIPGDDYEIRYVDGQSKKTLASSAIILRPVSAALSVPETCVGGSDFEVVWSGPKFNGYYITIVPEGAKQGVYKNYFYTKNEDSPTMLRAIAAAGPAEVRFVTDRRDLTLATAKITILEASAKFTEFAESVVAGEKFQIKWEAANNKGDYITIVKASLPDGKYDSYIYAKNGVDQSLTAPDEPGEYELRYVTDKQNKVLARVPVMVVAE